MGDRHFICVLSSLYVVRNQSGMEKVSFNDDGAFPCDVVST